MQARAFRRIKQQSLREKQPFRIVMKPMLEAIASSLPEMFASAIHEDRIDGLLKHSAFQSAGADADDGAGVQDHENRGDDACAPRGRVGNRLRSGRLLRDISEGLHERVGPRRIQCALSGQVLPCHAAETIEDLAVDNVRTTTPRRDWIRWQRLQRLSWRTVGCRSSAKAASARTSTLAGPGVRPWRLSATLPRPIRLASNRRTGTLWTIALSSRPLLRAAIAEDIYLDAA
jgi:hypothetical protein